MLHILTGRHAYGKTTHLINNVIKVSLEQNKRVLLVVPRQITFQTDEALLNLLGAKDASDVDVFSFKRFAEHIFKLYGAQNKTSLSDSIASMLMYQTLQSLSDKLQVYQKNSNPAFINQILAQIKFFKSNNITSDDVRSIALKFNGGLNNKLNDTALIYDAYNLKIQGQYYDDGDIMNMMKTLLEQNNYFDGKTIVFDGFSVFSKQQMNIIALAVKNADDVYITACCDDIFDNNILSSFAYVNKSMKQLVAQIKKQCGKDCQIDICNISQFNDGFSPYHSSNLKYLESNIYKFNIEKISSDGSIKLFEADNILQECDFVAKQIKKLIRSGSYRCKDIAVAFKNTDTYAQNVINCLKKYGVPVFDDKRQPVKNSPLIIAVSALLNLSVPGGFTTDNIFKYLKSGLSCLSEDQIYQLENYCFTWNITGCELKKEFVKNPEGFSVVFNEKSLQVLNLLNESRASLINEIMPFVENSESKSAKEFCAALYDFLKSSTIYQRLVDYAVDLEQGGHLELAAEQGTIWDEVVNLLSDISVISDDSHISCSEFTDLFNIGVNSITLGKLPAHFDEVTICSYDKLTNYSPLILFAMGCNENVFPNYNSKFGLFSEYERNNLLDENIQVQIVSDEDDDVLYEHFLVYHALSSARKKLYVTSSKLALNGDKLEKSDIYSLIDRCFIDLSFISSDVPFDEYIQSQSSAFEFFAINHTLQNEEIDTLSYYFSNNAEYADKMLAIAHINQKKEFSIQNKTEAKNLFGSNIRLSASRIESYESCPFKYFLEYSLGAKARKKAQYNNQIIGNTVHYVLEYLVKNHTHIDFIKENEQALKNEADSYLKQYLADMMGGEEDKSSRFLYNYYRTSGILSATIKRMIIEFSDSDFEPVYFELELGNRKIPALKLEIEGGSVEIYGKIDRVDRLRIGDISYIKVVDYKTSASKTFELSDIVNGLNMQMLIYLINLVENGESFVGSDLIPAGVFYTLINSEPLVGDPSLNEFIKKGKQEGMMLDDEQIKNAVSKSSNKYLFPFDNVYSNFDYSLIANKVKSIIINMCNSLSNGKISAKPFKKGKDNTPCEYCQYSSVCVKNEGVEYRFIKKESFKDTINKLREEENGEQVE